MAKSRYRLDIAWRFIRRNGPTSNPTLAAHLGTSMNATAQILARLKRKGYIRREGSTRKAVWLTIGDKPPECMWGMSEGGNQGLRAGHAQWQKSLALAFAAKGYPNLPFSGTQNDSGVVKCARESAPARIAIPSLGDLARQLA